MKYFFLSPLNSRSSAVACAPQGTSLPWELISGLQGVKKLPFDLTLKKLKFGGDKAVELDDLSGLKYLWFDYQLNSLAWPIFSARMRELIDRHLTGEEGIDWISVTIHQGTTASREYYLLRFNEKKNVLNLEASTFVPNHPDLLIKAVFAQDKISSLSVFSEFFAIDNSWQIPHSVCVSETIRQQAKKERFTGLHYEDARVT